MAAEAEAAREARAKIIKADGEMKATKYLREAASVLSESSSALQLRYLQVNKGKTDFLVGGTGENRGESVAFGHRGGGGGPASSPR